MVDRPDWHMLLLTTLIISAKTNPSLHHIHNFKPTITVFIGITQYPPSPPARANENKKGARSSCNSLPRIPPPPSFPFYFASYDTAPAYLRAGNPALPRAQMDPPHPFIVRPPPSPPPLPNHNKKTVGLHPRLCTNLKVDLLWQDGWLHHSSFQVSSRARY